MNAFFMRDKIFSFEFDGRTAILYLFQIALAQAVIVRFSNFKKEIVRNFKGYSMVLFILPEVHWSALEVTRTLPAFSGI